MQFIGTIKTGDHEYLHFGPFNSYEEADNFIQQKFYEYINGRCAYVDGLIAPVLIPERRV